jgi:hypothetical protein
MFQRLLKTKTFWVALAGICTAIGVAVSGEITWLEAAKLIGEGILVLCVRDGIAKVR